MKTKNKITVEQGIQIPSGASNGSVLTSDASGNGSWQTLPLAHAEVYEQTSQPSTTNLGAIWIDSDAPIPVVARPMTYADLAALQSP